MITRRLEAALTKRRILEIYLNVDRVGRRHLRRRSRGAHLLRRAGVGPVSAEQSALLAGSLINPRLLQSGRAAAPPAARQRIILGRMGMAAGRSRPRPRARAAEAARPAAQEQEPPAELETLRRGSGDGCPDETAEPPPERAGWPPTPVTDPTVSTGVTVDSRALDSVPIAR